MRKLYASLNLFFKSAFETTFEAPFGDLMTTRTYANVEETPSKFITRRANLVRKTVICGSCFSGRVVSLEHGSNICVRTGYLQVFGVIFF